ncbi:MAG: ribosome small subunit-dependent GTPase A [Chromatiaceae bacterium]|nr:MAG: ribosome small subunit-dependent GTPase A [Chromatiaceae bacterium]
MPRRHLSERQRERIRLLQERRRNRLQAHLAQTSADPDDDPIEAPPQPGRVMVRHGRDLAVEDAAGGLQHCVCRRSIGEPVCGDQVVWQATGSDTGVVTALLPRTTVLSRPDYSGRDKPLAANVSLLIIVVAPRPAPSGFLVDQYLVSAELLGVQALLLCNKMDLLAGAEHADFLAGFDHYQQIGYPLLALSVRADPSAAALRQRCANETAILLGQSGVGKSSLVKALLPDQAVQIGRLSQATGLGRHTTSAATCYRLDRAGYLIDSPGVRSFRLGAIDRATLQRGFREFQPYLGRCRFRDCTHRNEPDCALQAAVADGAIAPLRLETFQQLAAGLDTAY